MDRKLEALERLYRQRYDRFKAGLAPLVGGHEAAHDVVQEAFAQAIARRRSFRGNGSLEGWVWRIAFRLALRRQRRSRAHVREIADVHPAILMPERDSILAEALRSLPPRRRLMVFLHYFADLSYAEIARLCGVREGTVAASLTQARRVLREVLEHEEVYR